MDGWRVLDVLTIPDVVAVTGCVISIDPGSNDLGCSVTYYDLSTLSIISIESIHIKVSKLVPDYSMLASHGDRKSRYSTLKKTLTRLIEYHSPVAVVSEAPFFNRFTPLAYGTLTEVVAIVKEAVLSVNPYTPMRTYPPMTVKKAIGAKKYVGKNPVLDAVLNNEEIMKAMVNNVHYCTPDEVDSIAVGYAYLEEQREGYYYGF